MKRYTLLIYLLATMGWAFAQDATETWFEQANTAYNSGNYDTAVVMFERILATDMESVPVYYNMGNAYYKMHNYPMAIYCYEKALKLDPSDDDVQTNLAIANRAIVDKIEPVPQPFYVRGWHNARAWLSGDQWAWCSVAAFALLLFALFLFLRARRMAWRKFGFFMGIIFAIVLALSVLFAAQLKRAATTQDHAIIMAPTVTVKSSPSQQSVDLFVLHEGSKVDVLEGSNGWNKVRIANGSIGWLEADKMRPF
ncbi:MAG: tetratricopeptide repeat protein [Bacteroidales bacterium]|nr:tetratricopeptide repeat protein [Bacteroidales bacterium]